MLVWRLVRPEYAPGLDGLGARRFGGRWNSPGQAMVYCASSLALAVLEYFVHVPASMRQSGRMPRLHAVGLTLVPAVEIEHFAYKADAGFPDPKESSAFGDNWLNSRRGLTLSVPSRVVPLERNVLINPLHPDISGVEITVQTDFIFDSRLSGG